MSFLGSGLDLDAILRTLAAPPSSSLAIPPSSSLAAPPSSNIGTSNFTSSLESRQNNARFMNNHGGYHHFPTQNPVLPQQKGVHFPAPSSSERSTMPIKHATEHHENSNGTIDQRIDPWSITTWPAALRYVMKAFSQDANLASRVRALIQSQSEHERQWFAGRKSLIQMQNNRAESSNRVADVLRAVGGLVSLEGPASTPEEDRAEVVRYDTKVHRACSDMVVAMTAELSTMNIPFFALRMEYISTGIVGAEDLTVDSPVGIVPLVSPEELKVLQIRMIRLLEDLTSE